MGKNVYSVVLSEEVIAAIDALAVQRGFSRSGLINHVLAEYSGLSTPEHRMRELAQWVRSRAAGGELRADVSPAGGLTLHTALRFKYNPALRYQLDFYENGGLLCELRVSLRSQNEELLSCLAEFFKTWLLLEQKYMANPPAQELISFEARRFRRELRRPAGSYGGEALGDAVADYVTAMDSCMKAFFGNLNEPAAAIKAAEAAYLAILPRGGLAGSL